MSKHGDITQLYNGNDLFSSLAYKSIKPDIARLLGLVLGAIREAGEIGMTCDEAEVKLELPHQTVSARFTQLKAKDLIVWDGNYRNTRSGRRAAVYVLKEAK